MAGPHPDRTGCVHAGAPRREPYYSLIPPVVRSAPFTFESTEELIELVEGTSGRTQPEYSRMGNPTVTRVENRLAALEGAATVQLFASGMAAVTTTLLTLLQSGDHVVLAKDCYKRTRDFITQELSRFGVEGTLADMSTESIEAGLTPETRVVLVEVPSNPRVQVVDIERLAQIARQRDFTVIIDSTFATPVNLKPLQHGADLVLHSATKYLGGHHDLVAGVLAGSEELVEPVSQLLMTLGGICSPDTAFLLDRGLKTLSLRVAQHNENGRRAAEFLADHPNVGEVLYPGLASVEDHSVAENLMNGFGGVLSFTVGQDLDDARRFTDALDLIKIAPSLGGTESLAEPVAIMGYWKVPCAEREALEIPENLVRLSLGIEETEDLIADIEQALESV